MKYEDALKKIDGAQSVGGDLIVVRDGKHIVVGKSVQGMLIVADSDEAKAIAVEAGIEVEVVDIDGEKPPEAGQLPAEPPPEASQLPADTPDEPAPAPKTKR